MKATRLISRDTIGKAGTIKVVNLVLRDTGDEPYEA